MSGHFHLTMFVSIRMDWNATIILFHCIHSSHFYWMQQSCPRVKLRSRWPKSAFVVDHLSVLQGNNIDLSYIHLSCLHDIFNDQYGIDPLLCWQPGPIFILHLFFVHSFVHSFVLKQLIKLSINLFGSFPFILIVFRVSI